MAAFVAPPVTAAGQAALMRTLLGTRTAQAATFNARVVERIAAQQNVTTGGKAGSR